MTFFADRVVEVTTTAGIVDYVLAGPPDGFRAFSAGFSPDDPVFYVADNAAAGGSDFETGFGAYVDSPDRVTRALVLSSSNAGAAVDWPAGTKQVWSAPVAAVMGGILQDHIGGAEPAWKASGVRWIDSSATPAAWKIYAGGAWRTIGTINLSSGEFIPYRNGVALPAVGTASGELATLGAGGLFDQARIPLLAAASELTIAAGVITPAAHYHSVDTEVDAAADDLATISTTGLAEGALLFLRAESAARVVTVKDGIGNVALAGGDFLLDDLTKRLVLQRRGAAWDEIARSHVPPESPGEKAAASLHMTGDGTAAIVSSQNVDSISDLGTGFYRATFTNAFATANYRVIGAVGDTAVAGAVGMVYTRARNAAWFEFGTYNHAGSIFDGRDIDLVFFGDLA